MIALCVLCVLCILCAPPDCPLECPFCHMPSFTSLRLLLWGRHETFPRTTNTKCAAITCVATIVYIDGTLPPLSSPSLVLFIVIVAAAINAVGNLCVLDLVLFLPSMSTLLFTITHHMYSTYDNIQYRRTRTQYMCQIKKKWNKICSMRGNCWHRRSYILFVPRLFHSIGPMSNK